MTIDELCDFADTLEEIDTDLNDFGSRLRQLLKNIEDLKTDVSHAETLLHR